MKKLLALLMVVIMCMAVFTGCGSKEPANTDAPQDGNDAAEVTGEVFDAGNVSALVPEGWVAFPVSDVFSEEADAVDPDAIQICKGAESEWDLFTKPYVQINYYGPDSFLMTPDKEWYDNAEDIEPMQLGENTWYGFTGTSMDIPIAMLWTEGEEYQYQASIWLEMTDDSISLEDADVQAILESVQPSAE